MGVFNWNAADGEAVITRFFWYFLIAAGGLTAFTIVAWTVVTRRKPKLGDEEDHSPDNERSGDSRVPMKSMLCRTLRCSGWFRSEKDD